MRFHPSPEQDAIVDAIKGTLESEWSARLAAYVETEEDFDQRSWDALMSLGIGGLLVPEAQGGTGLGLVDAALVMEAAGYCAAPGPLGEQMLAAGLLAAAGKPDPQRLAALVEGRAVVSLAWGGKWHPDSWDVDFDGSTVDGTVRFVPAAKAAHLFVVGVRGGGLVLVEAGEDTAITPIPSTDHSRRLSTVRFAGARAVPLCAAGDPSVTRLFDAALVLSAADALGTAQRCLDMTVGYAKDREQFGQPIGRFQALKHQIADLALDVEPARALMWYAAYACDSDLPDASRAAAMAKAHIADRQESVARGAVAAHGGIGYTWEYELSIWYRRALHDHAWLGTPQVHRARAAEMAQW